MATQLGLDQLEPLFNETRAPYDGSANALNVLSMMLDELREAGRVMYTQATYEAVARVDTQLGALEKFLAENNLAGLVLDGEDAQQLTNTIFEQRARMSEASAMRDPPLTAHGVDQVGYLAEHLAGLPEDERPQLIVSSPYQRCVNSAAPLAEALGVRLCVEPGMAEWYPPVAGGAGRHPTPPSGSDLGDERVDTSWTPLLYPSPSGETLDALRARMQEVLRRIEARCSELGVERVALVAHAATNIALGQVLVQRGIEGAGQHTIHAATASTSEFKRAGEHWKMLRNGDTSYLPDGSEREWDFSFLPENVTEPGMPADWEDPHKPKDAKLVFIAKL
ncbi:hypothetical protein MCUN1_001307 [Malassezia cuniculi]|uniref:Uncharacterized protein n=1 Tax=Malassezia cuniculi TaxID=948313 RepID=A0AAF0EU76_9BASI|nr:hypothetical protein MCUN1_001307 [Malassezia cuniculi]